MLTWPPKDADERLDYQVDWSTRIDTDTIITSVWTIPLGITKESDYYSDTITTIWLSGGTTNTDYELRNTITTASGRILDQTVVLLVRER